MIKKKIVFGVCGIGRGHTYRQFPIISHFSKKAKIVIFAFGESYSFYSKVFKNKDNIKIYPVFVPWLHGSLLGIDYKKTANDSFNKNINYISKNFLAMDNAFSFLGKPDLVITDYEPVSAQFAYSLDVKIVTIDQQSKYFYKDYPDIKNALSIEEERSRLGMFFPKADKRIACSFFIPPSKITISKNFNVETISPVIRDDIIFLKKNCKSKKDNVLIYLSPYSEFTQKARDVLGVLSSFKNYSFHLFVAISSDFFREKHIPVNVKINKYEDKNFLKSLNIAGSVICTAGHTFISEALYLSKPIYAVPLKTYEQNYNAEVINKYKFGVTRNNISVNHLKYFLKNIDLFKDNIVRDNTVLLNKRAGQEDIIRIINKFL